MNQLFQKSWVKSGLLWGVWMFIFTFIIGYFIFSEEYNLKKTAFYFITWMIGGLVYGYVSEYIHKRIKSKNR